MSKNLEANSILKNTLYLYVRFVLSTIVSLYTSRVVLNALGVVDFGIYNVVGGFVLMLSFVNSSMALGIQRYLSFEIGKGDSNSLSNVFSTSINIQFLVVLVVLLLGETIGLYLFGEYLVFPESRINAAKAVYHASLFTFIVNILSVPFNALIIAHERMNVFAWVSLMEVILKLGVALSFSMIELDNLASYSILLLLVSLIIRFVYGVYCKRFLKHYKYKLVWDKTLFIEMLKYNTWNLWGSIAAVSCNQGINVVLNIFFGPVVNAAKGIAVQVSTAVNGLVLNLQVAFNPQIIKSYAKADLEKMHKLVFQSAKFSFFLLFLICLPLLFETNMILKLWLLKVPDYSLIFSRLILIGVLVDSISGSLGTSALASGKIKKYQMVVGGIQFLILPIVYLGLENGLQPDFAFIITTLFSIISLFSRLFIIAPLVQLPPGLYTRKVLVPISITVLFSLLLPFLVSIKIQESLFRLVLQVFVSSFSLLTCIYFVGLEEFERVFVVKFLSGKFKKVKQ